MQIKLPIVDNAVCNLIYGFLINVRRIKLVPPLTVTLLINSFYAVCETTLWKKFNRCNHQAIH